MIKTAFGVFSIALSALLLELNLIRVFDVLWYPNMAYMVITLAVFSFGLAGVFLSIKPIEKTENTWRVLSLLTFLMAVWVILLRPFIDNLPFDYLQLAGDKAGLMAWRFFLIYIVICVPFFFAGLVLSLVFSHYAEQIRELYFWDLIGAALGCILLVPLLPRVGAAGVMYFVAALCLVSTICFSGGKSKVFLGLAAVLLVAVIGFTVSQDRIKTFEPHMNKRGFAPLSKNNSEGTWWDPISKIDVLNSPTEHAQRKWIAYDGGTQSSYFYAFDGNYDHIKDNIRNVWPQHFWNVYVAASHYLKKGTNPKVLIIGSAGGQELKAALSFGASEVDAIELVGTVVALGKTQYADFIGDIMNDPRANVIRGEGRSFLRRSGKTYDIIQMFSNHTSSSIAAGSGAMQPNYLQTVEAYKEYFSSLSENGVLHINHHVYPKMVATAAKAWAELGRTDFRKHVFVSDLHGVQNDLPTVMIKMSPWTENETHRMMSLLARFYFPVNPLEDQSFLGQQFFEGELSQEYLDKVPYRLEPPTDDRPFFNSLRKNLETLPDENHKLAVNHGVSGLLNSQKSSGYPIDVMHLIVTAGAALVFAFIFTLGPLFFARSGREKWEGKSSFVGYFSCLGLGFIVFELVFIQIFMKVVGYPLYAYTAVLFTFLFGAGLGSLSSKKLQIIERGRIWLPFVGVVLSTLLVVFAQSFLFDLILEYRTFVRILATIVLIFPLAFFLGMPFPLGILAIQNKPAGTIAWAWGLNGLFTVIGGVFCSVFAVYYGFKATMMVAVLAYLIAYLAYRNLYRGYQAELAAN